MVDIAPGAAERLKFMTAARDALLSRMFVGQPPRQIFDRATGAYVNWTPAKSARRFSTFLGVAEECCVRSGFDSNQIRDLPKPSLARLILGSDPQNFGISASSDGAAYNATGMFSNILLDAAHVSLRRSYDDSRTTFQTWMKQGEPVEDFKRQHRSVSGEMGDPRAIPEDGSFEETTFADGKESFQLTTWGEIFSLSWQAVVNDSSLGAFGEIPGKLGGAMRRKQNKLAYGVLKDNANMADGGALFNSTAQTTVGGHNNLTTGVGAPSVTTLNALTKKMMEQRGLNTSEGGALNIMPRFIIAGPALRGTILELLGSIANPSVGGSAVGNSGVKNIWENALEPVIEGELGASASGGSDVAWYLAGDPSECDTAEYAFLDGFEFPAIETERAFTSLALKWRMYHAFVTHALDYRGLQKHAGA